MRDLFRPGEKLTRDALNNIPRETLRAIHAGPGVRIMPTGDGISISTVQQQRKSVTDSGYIPRVLVLPALPTPETGLTLTVFWLDAAQGMSEKGEAGTGDNQKWECTYPQDRFYPQEKYTTLSGVPV